MKIKKLLVLIVLIIFSAFCLCVSGCSNTNENIVENDSERFKVVDIDKLDETTDRNGYRDKVIVFYDTETNVMYMFYKYQPYGGGVTIMVDKDGNPLLYQGEKNANS